MDGFKKRLNDSVQFKLSFSLTLAILLIAVVAGVFSFVSAFDEAHELQDDMLRHVAALFEKQHLSPAVGGHAKGDNEESRVLVQRLVDDPQMSGVNMAAGAGAPLPLSASQTDGLHTLTVDGESFRVLVQTTALGERIAVAQETWVRDKIARDGAWRTVMPLLILMPILLVIVADLVQKMFRPIASLSHEIDQRAEQALHPITESHLPSEVRPFVVAINRLFGRVDQAMQSQRRFVADAAHELRSPLTAMSLQAERLALADMSATAQERLQTLRQGIERGRNLLDQLLALAKAQSALEPPTSSTSVQATFRRVLAQLWPLAEAKHIDMGIEGDQDARVQISELDLMTLVSNLVDNAIRYTPDGGQVDVSVTTTEHHAVLCIQDSGPGIPAAERARVFDPFYRTLGNEQVGSGLGLSIVKAITERTGATIHLGDADQNGKLGLSVSVSLPLATLTPQKP
jgi:two-component system OmpR family sensor kinase